MSGICRKTEKITGEVCSTHVIAEKILFTSLKGRDHMEEVADG
jgi:hypothetical protein